MWREILTYAALALVGAFFIAASPRADICASTAPGSIERIVNCSGR